MPKVDIIDEAFMVAGREHVRAALLDSGRWMAVFPRLTFSAYDDRGLDGVRWSITGEMVGTAEVWLEEFGDGTIVHSYLRANPGLRHRSRPRLEKWVRKHYALPLKRYVMSVKDDVEAGRAVGEPRVPLPERVVSPPTTDSNEGQRDMADQTTSSILISANPASVMSVIADFDSYPEWAKGVKSATVLTEFEDGRAGEVAFVLDAAPIRDEYTLTYDWDGDSQVSWSLVEAKMLKAMEGAYILRPKGDATEVTYQLAVDLSIPMIGMLRRKGEKVIIDTALKGLKQRVESLS